MKIGLASLKLPKDNQILYMIRLSTLLFFFLLSSTIFLGCSNTSNREKKRPNILWITVEDISPDLGCYGDPLAHTPTLDAMASKGFKYNHAIANAPVCAPARNAIITGMYPSSLGTLHMRSFSNAIKCLRRGNFMYKMPINKQNFLSAVDFVYDVVIPHFFKECFSHIKLSGVSVQNLSG